MDTSDTRHIKVLEIVMTSGVCVCARVHHLSCCSRPAAARLVRCRPRQYRNVPRCCRRVCTPRRTAGTRLGGRVGGRKKNHDDEDNNHNNNSTGSSRIMDAVSSVLSRPKRLFAFSAAAPRLRRGQSCLMGGFFFFFFKTQLTNLSIFTEACTFCLHRLDKSELVSFCLTARLFVLSLSQRSGIFNSSERQREERGAVWDPEILTFDHFNRSLTPRFVTTVSLSRNNTRPALRLEK